MSCFLLLILLFQIFEFSFEAEAEKQSPWTQRSRIEITFKSVERSNSAIDHNAKSLFYGYAERNGITLKEVNLRRINDCPDLPSVLKYEANVMDCHEFQNYLYYLRPQLYSLKIGHVKCDRMTSTICLWYTWKTGRVKCDRMASTLCSHICSDKDYRDVTSCT